MNHREIIVQRARRLADFPAQRIPEPADETIERARAIAGGTVFFYNTEPLEVGLKKIDWDGYHIHHQEWPAQLNRFGYLAPLASAYLATKDETFPAAARSYVEDWIDSHDPSGALVPRDNRLNMSIRLGSGVHFGWGGTLPAFLGSPSFDDAFLDKVLESMSAQAQWLSGELTDRGNWRISQLDALVFTALRFPFLDNAKHLLAVGIRGMRNALATQFLRDGVHVERTPSYHAWMTKVLCNYYRLARMFKEADANVDAALVEKALDYALQGHLSGVNDASAPLFDADEPQRLAERARTLAWLGLVGKVPAMPPAAQVFEEAGQVFVRSSWEPNADYLAFDASTWGGAHTHLSRLSFTLRMGGRMLIADPGILSYEMSEPKGVYGKSTAAHTTLNLNGFNQSEADARLIRCEFTEDLALIHARYDGGYWSGEFGWTYRDGHGRGVFGIHERVLLWVRGEYVLVLDRMECDADAEVRSVWQMGATDSWQIDDAGLSWRTCNTDDVNLSLTMLEPTAGVAMECFAGVREPMRGWIADSEHRREPVAAPLVEFRYAPSEDAGRFSAVLACPFRGRQAPAYSASFRRIGGVRGVRTLDLKRPDGGIDRIAWSKELELPIEIDGELVTDAQFAWVRMDGKKRVTKRFLLDGSYLEVDGRQV